MRGRFESLAAWLPSVGVAVWLAAGRWQEAGFQARNWMILVTALCLALLIPLPSSRAAGGAPRRLAVGLGWMLLVGLVYFTR